MEKSKLIEEENKISHKEQFAIDVLTGLCSSPKQLPSKYFYDDIGSDIFQKITNHSDYYLTRTEFDILAKYKSTIPDYIEEDEIDIIELGAGDGHKSQLIIEGFLEKGKKVNFYPIDISGEAMNQLEKTIRPHENLVIHGVVAEYLMGLRFVRKKSKNKQIVLFLGSNIGNFDRVQNQAFLRQLWKSLNTDDLVLVGFDLKKSVPILTDAYNDSAGLTRDFNLNLLRRINTELGANFELENFEHFGSYNPILGAMESYLISKKPQKVFISEIQRSFLFDAYEPIHLENSFKFLNTDIQYLCEQTGFALENNFTDSNDYFIDSLWKVVKEV
jgi:dimethylhistidine N-methyltransferase